MKKITLGMITVLASAFAFGACDTSMLQGLFGSADISEIVSVINSIEKEEEKLDEWLESGIFNDSINSGASSTQPENSTGNGNNSGTDSKTHLYNDFTPSEKSLFKTYVGEVIPFIPNDEYYVEGYYDDADYENGMCFYTIGNTQSEFAAYRTMYSDYELTDTYTDEYNDVWYTYENGDLVVDMCFYQYEGENWLEVYVYSLTMSENGEIPDDGGDDAEGHDYTDFTSAEKALFETYVGEVIPFLANDEYYVEGYNDETDYENGMCFYTIGNTEMEFIFYRAMYSDYDLTETVEDEDGDLWYTYEKDGLIVDMCYYYDEGEYWLVVYVVSTGEIGGEIPDDGGEIPDDGEEGGEIVDDGTGVREVDFTQATNVKNVTDQGYYLDGCPTMGKVKVLVIPVEFSDVTAASKGYTTAKINTIFNGLSGTTDYYSVAEYYDISSYGQLDLDFVVLDSWFKPKNRSSSYKNATMNYDGENIFIGDQMIMDEALTYLEGRMDLSDFDSDGNDIIDAVVMINTLDINSDYDFNWAYRYWNIYTDNSGYYYEYDGVTANDYLWASYQFMLETYDDYGNVSYNKNTMNPYTYIHEFAHVLGADDYYDTSYSSDYGPMEGYDMMDAMMGDHNPYTKFNYGWLTKARLITATNSVTLTLESFTETGDAVIIANNWSDDLGAYQEYYVVVYYTNTGLNTGDGGFFDEEGIVVYHVNASLYSEVNDGEIYYDVANNNTDASDEYGTVNNLIELVKSAEGNYVFGEYDSLSASEKMDNGKKISYVFTVNDITEKEATVTFCVNN